MTKAAYRASQSLGVFLVILALSSCSKYTVAWRTLSAVKSAGVITQKVIVEGTQAQRKTCKGQYPIRTPQYAKCLGRWPEALRYWIQIVGPALNSMLIAAVAALVIAERVSSGLKGIWEMVRLGFCALLKIPSEFKALLGARLIQIEAVTKPLGVILKCQPQQ